MAVPQSARAAPARAGSDPRIEQLGGRLDQHDTQALALVQEIGATQPADFDPTAEELAASPEPIRSPAGNAPALAGVLPLPTTPASPETGFVVRRGRRRVGCVVAVAGGRFVAWSAVARLGDYPSAGEAHRAVSIEDIRLSRRRVRP
jgi:hypothetical protein